jgi:hypothetical protein
MLAIAETHTRLKAERFYRPWPDGRVFLRHFPALRTGLLSFALRTFRTPFDLSFWNQVCPKVRRAAWSNESSTERT